MSKTMAEVLEAHPEPEVDNGYWYCMCGHDYGVNFTTDSIPAHQAAALSAAGFGLVADAKAEAWVVGYNQGWRQGCEGVVSRPMRDPDYRQDPYDDEEGRALVEAIIERKAQDHDRS